MDNDILTGENLSSINLLIWTSFIGQFGKGGWIGGIVILASCEHNFIRVHENLVQYPSNNISIPNREMGQLAYTSPQSFLITLSYSLALGLS